MAYSSLTDFLALIRNTGGAAALAEVPGLDYVIAAMARAGMFRLFVGQTAPTSDFAATVWLKPSIPSWVAEGVVFLWDATTATYVPATPALWDALLSAVFSSYAFQSVIGGADTVAAATSLLVVQRAGPVATTLFLPAVAARSGKPLQVADWSSGVVGHTITLNPAIGSGSTIMRAASWALLSSPDQLAGITLYPSIDLNGWVIAP